MKKCSKCKVEKPLNEFYKNKWRKDGLTSYCKPCNKAIQRTTDYSKYKDYYKKHYEANKEKRNKQTLESKKRRITQVREYQAEYMRNKRANDLDYRIRDAVSTRINYALTVGYINKKDSTIEELGCTIKEYKVYLEQQFDKNMNWDNYGTYWEIDHIVPVSKNGSLHYTNTQPLTINENRSLGNRK